MSYFRTYTKYYLTVFRLQSVSYFKTYTTYYFKVFRPVLCPTSGHILHTTSQYSDQSCDKSEHCPGQRRVKSELCPGEHRDKSEHCPGQRRVKSEHCPEQRRFKSEHCPGQRRVKSYARTIPNAVVLNTLLHTVLLS